MKPKRRSRAGEGREFEVRDSSYDPLLDDADVNDADDEAEEKEDNDDGDLE